MNREKRVLEYMQRKPSQKVKWTLCMYARICGACTLFVPSQSGCMYAVVRVYVQSMHCVTRSPVIWAVCTVHAPHRLGCMYSVCVLLFQLYVQCTYICSTDAECMTSSPGTPSSFRERR